LGKTPIYLREQPINVSPFARYLVGIINKIGDGFHIYEFKFIDPKTIRKTVVDDQIRLEFDMVGRYKYSENNQEFEEEDEIIINDFDSAVNILYGLGCTKKYYYEKMREIWKYKNTEFVFDITPG
jgi:hypothetical protein